MVFEIFSPAPFIASQKIVFLLYSCFTLVNECQRRGPVENDLMFFMITLGYKNASWGHENSNKIYSVKKANMLEIKNMFFPLLIFIKS